MARISTASDHHQVTEGTIAREAVVRGLDSVIDELEIMEEAAK